MRSASVAEGHKAKKSRRDERSGDVTGMVGGACMQILVGAMKKT